MFLAIIVLVVVIMVMKASSYRSCPKCGGKGYWEAVRQRERCDKCRGSGKVPKQPS